MEKIVISGIGVISPIAYGAQSYWEALQQGKSGIKSYDLIAELDIPSKKAGHIDSFKARNFIKGINYRRLSRYSQFLIAAVEQAIQDSQLNLSEIKPDRKGLVFSTNRGSSNETLQYLEKLYSDGPQAVSPMLFSQTVTNAPATYISIKHNLKGVSTVLSGITPLDLACRYLKQNRADIVICAGVDVLGKSNFYHESAHHMDMLATQYNGYSEDSRPFDSRRNGYIISEGSAAFILEKESSLKKRGARSYCEVASVSVMHDGDCTQFVNRRNPLVIEKTYQKALKKAGIEPKQVGYINSMANSSKGVDEKEAQAIQGIFNGFSAPMVSSTKGAIGETMGAGHAMSLAHAALSIYNQEYTPTLNLSKPDAETSKLNLIMEKPVKANVEFCLAGSFEQGGNTQAVVLKRSN